MTWRNFKAYFDTHIWTMNRAWSWHTCSVCGEVRTRKWMIAHEADLYPQWWLMRDGSIRIGPATFPYEDGNAISRLPQEYA